MALEQVLRARYCLGAGRLDDAEALARDAASDPHSAPEALRILGLAAHRRGRLEEAEKALRRALERDGAVAACHNDLGNVLQDRGKLEEAVRAYRRALRLHPALAEAWNDLGTARYAKGELEGAIQCYRQAVRLRPDHVVAYANLGAVYRKIGLLGEARRALQRELLLRTREALRSLRRRLGGREPDLKNAATLARLGDTQLEEGNARHAERIARAALELDARCPAALRLLSAARLRLGRAAEALDAARAAREAAPHDPAAALQLARALHATGNRDAAIEAYEAALRQKPRADALGELGELLLQRRDWPRALSVLRGALELRPEEPRHHLMLGEAHHRQGALGEAEAAYRRALELDPLALTACVRLSDVLRDAGRLDDAQAAAQRAIALDDESPLGHFALGMAHKAKGRADAAIRCFEHARSLDPQRAQTLQQLALALRESDRMEEAAEHLRAALKLRPDDAGLVSDLGMVLGDTMRYDEALRCFARALELDPGSAATVQRQALLVDHLGDRAGGEKLLRRALELAPADHHVRYNIGLQHLKYGEFAEGWDGYEERRHFDSFAGKHRTVPLPEWDGGALDGRTLLVLPEQGLGDEIMFGSCLPEVIARAAHVVIECDAKLEAIFRRSFERSTVVSRQRTIANDWVTRLDPRPELQMAAGSLARHFRRSQGDFPQHRGFLRADSGKVAHWRAKLDALGAGRKIGLSWRGGVGYTGKTRRSLALEQLLPVLRLPGVRFVNLQYTEVRDEIRALDARHGVKVHHWQEAIDDYDQTAALVAALDGVLTVCTAIVHLTGALGRPALVMVPFGADWRYGASDERMAWYPSVRLVRQSRVGEWGDVLAQVARRLGEGWPAASP